METKLSAAHLYRACNLLFGEEIDVSPQFLRYLKPAGLRAAYRKKAMETHPDRAAALDLSPAELEARFKEVSEAYFRLRDYLENPHRFQPVEAGRPRDGSTVFRQAGPAQRSWFYQGAVPKRRLLLGQYLFYRGLISYRQLIEAIVWQKRGRPVVGMLARRWGWLDEKEVDEILRQRLRGERFGETAVRCGYLSQEELHSILVRQRLLQPRIGRYFVEKGILASSFVETMAAALRRHNGRYR